MNTQNPSYVLTTTTANFNQGILNIPTRYSEFFGPHGHTMTVALEDRPLVESKIDRNNVRNHSPRTSNVALKDYFQATGQMGSQYEIVISQNRVRIKLLKR